MGNLVSYWNLNLSHLDMVLQARADFGNPVFRKVVITTCWIIWKTRNGVIFYGGQVNIFSWKRHFKEEFSLVCTKANPAKQIALNLWRDSFSV